MNFSKLADRMRLYASILMTLILLPAIFLFYHVFYYEGEWLGALVPSLVLVAPIVVAVVFMLMGTEKILKQSALQFMAVLFLFWSSIFISFSVLGGGYSLGEAPINQWLVRGVSFFWIINCALILYPLLKKKISDSNDLASYRIMCLVFLLVLPVVIVICFIALAFNEGPGSVNGTLAFFFSFIVMEIVLILLRLFWLDRCQKS